MSYSKNRQIFLIGKFIHNNSFAVVVSLFRLHPSVANMNFFQGLPSYYGLKRLKFYYIFVETTFIIFVKFSKGYVYTRVCVYSGLQSIYMTYNICVSNLKKCNSLRLIRLMPFSRPSSCTDKVEFPSRTPRQDKLLQIPTLTTALNPGQYNWGLRRSYMVYRVYPSCILAVSADQKTVSK